MMICSVDPGPVLYGDTCSLLLLARAVLVIGSCRRTCSFSRSVNTVGPALCRPINRNRPNLTFPFSVDTAEQTSHKSLRHTFSHKKKINKTPEKKKLFSANVTIFTFLFVPV